MKSMKSYFYWLVVLILLFLCSCTAKSENIDDSQPTQSADEFERAPDFDLDPETLSSLEIYPLRSGSSWIYDFLGFDAEREVLWRVVDTVVDAQIIDGYYIAELERKIELLEGSPPTGFIFQPEEGAKWFLIDGSQVYEIDSSLDIDLSQAWLALDTTFPGRDQGWYPDPQMRQAFPQNMFGYRYASDAYQDQVPGDKTYICYNIVTEVENGKQEATFCEALGYYYFEFNNYGEASGYRIELRGFSLQ
jgi:hypothetical protein